jgi:hypothetical protein
MAMQKMDNDHRPHLWIPEQEVTLVSHVPRGRAKARDVNHIDHGKKLSKGLQDIVDAYNTRLTSGDALSGEDIRVFQITLPDGIKLSDQKKFLTEEGLTLNYYQDESHAIVSTSKARFDRLAGRVDAYRDKNRKKDFKYIEDFSYPDAVGKQTYSLRRFIEEFGEASATADIEMVVLPLLDKPVAERVEKNLIGQIIAAEGTIPSNPFTLSDGTRVIRATVPIASVEQLALDSSVCQVLRTSFYSSVSPSALTQHKASARLDETVDLDTLPVVAILDTGVDFPDELEPLIIEHWKPSGLMGGDCIHGTQVAGKAAFADVGRQLANEIMTPRARIIDCNIYNGVVPLDDGGFIKNVTEAVEAFHERAKIYSLSFNAEWPIESESISLLGFELDALAHRYDVRFIISTGNHHLAETEDDIQAILDDTDIRISAPADSMLNIAVGAIAGVSDDNCISDVNQVAPYARIGPGFAGFMKPDVVAYGANLTKGGGATSTDEYSILLGIRGLIAQEAGTSFTAPVVAGDLAEILSGLPDESLLLAQTLLYHGAQHLWNDIGLEGDDAGVISDWYGRGLSDPSSSSFSNWKRVTFVHVGEMNRLTKQRIKFWMPSILAEASGNKMAARVSVTCLSQPPIDRNKGANYLGAYARASLHKKNSKGEGQTSNPSGGEGRKPWDTCHHFFKEFATFSPGDWEIWLELFTRDDVEKQEDVPFALAVTIEDLDDNIFDIYEAIQEETQGRFPVLSTVRLPVR